MSSIKRDVKKKVLPRPDAEKIFVSRSSPLPVSVPLDSLERVRCGLFAISVAFASSGDDANRVLDLASGPGIWVSTMVLLEARGLSLFLVIRGGIACNSDSVPKHTGPNSLTDTHLEPSVSRTRPTTTRENRRRWKGPLHHRRSSFLPMQLCGVEIRSFLPNR